MKNPVHTKSAPAAIGPYSQAIEIHGTVYCSGQIGLDPETGALVSGGIEIETRRVLQNLGAVLEAAGLDFSDVVKTTIFLADLADFETVNRIYGEHFDPPYPARSTVQVARLPRNARVEIDAIALRRSIL
ncbi:MAG: RidA family protein [Candidatus Binatus sp.]|uniref:RidA family protein n=1 Tax=Candidatus Binatus sp. TaxID=2811406 RepID=UPI0027211FFD|nr:RidA family protein [Candidatus Binatus sp.]MDO8431998.1 RidA family protein [Candidatus Binatus sp.]